MTVGPTRYGVELAEKVADHLIQKGDICYSHKDYCGVGFCFRNGEFLYDYATDGEFKGGWYPSSPSPIKRFPDRSAFVAWLAEQTNESLSGEEEPEDFLRHNQRITRERLEQLLAEAEAAEELRRRPVSTSCVVCGEPGSGKCADCGAWCCPNHQIMEGGAGTQAQGIFRCSRCAKNLRRRQPCSQPAPRVGVGVTGFEKFAALWDYMELECKGCGHRWPRRLTPFILAVIPAFFGVLIVLFPIGALGGPTGDAPWYKPWYKAILVGLFFFGLALPFLLFGAVTAALALGVKCLIYLVSFAWRCPKCGRRQWSVANFGVAAFRSVA